MLCELNLLMLGRVVYYYFSRFSALHHTQYKIDCRLLIFVRNLYNTLIISPYSFYYIRKRTTKNM